MRRRELLVAGGAAVLGACTKERAVRPSWERSAVAVLRAASYDVDLVDVVKRGVTACGLDVRGKRVLLKPNVVEFSRETVINTHPKFVAAVVQVISSLGAASVEVGEGPGHRRDTMGLIEEAGYFDVMPDLEKRFTDLNRDEVGAVEQFGSIGRMWFPQTVLAADVIISLPKMKTHHWAGATLSMKNYFGLVPGELYGWPKNVLHQHGILESIVALTKQFSPKSFAIVDGIVGMEGNGPIQGEPRPAGVVVMGQDLVAVDATCCRVMGIVPDRMRFLRMAEDLGWWEAERIEQRAERVEAVKTRFGLMPMWKDLGEG